MAAGTLLEDGRTEVKVITEGVLADDEGRITLNLMASDAGAMMLSRTVPDGGDVDAEKAEVWALAERKAADAGIVPFGDLKPTWSCGPVDDGVRISLLWPGQLGAPPAIDNRPVADVVADLERAIDGAARTDHVQFLARMTSERDLIKAWRSAQSSADPTADIKDWWKGYQDAMDDAVRLVANGYGIAYWNGDEQSSPWIEWRRKRSALGLTP